MPNYNHYNKNHIKKKHVVHRMVNKTSFTDSGCWLWVGSQDGRGYGQICLIPGMTPEKVHRIAAYHFLGYDGILQINHKTICPNKHCWNPDHLYIGTHQQNVIDSRIVGTHANQYGPTVSKK